MPDRTDSDSRGTRENHGQPMGDEQLLQAVREGDSAAFGELFERHRGAVLAVARMHSRNEADAQDLTSEAFTRVLGLLREGRGPQQFLRTYLVTAVSRLAADRANDLTRTRPEDPQPEGALDRVEFFDDIVVKQVDSVVVARAFATLPERWQEILWYLEIEGRRPRQVASVMGVQPNTVSALGKRAREGLRTAYMQEHVSAQALEDCSQYSSMLGAFTRGSLTPSRTKMVQDHLDECRRCTAEYLQLQDLGLGLRGWVLPVLAGLPLWGGAGGQLAASLGAAPALGVSTAARGGHGAPSADGAGGASGHAPAGGSPSGSGTSAASAAGGAGGLSTPAIAAAVGAVVVLGASAAGLAALTNDPEPSAPVAASSASPAREGSASPARPGATADSGAPRSSVENAAQPQPQDTALPVPFRPEAVAVAPQPAAASSPPERGAPPAPARTRDNDVAGSAPAQPRHPDSPVLPTPAPASATPGAPSFTLFPTPPPTPVRGEPRSLPATPSPEGTTPDPVPSPSSPESEPTRSSSTPSPVQTVPVPSPSESDLPDPTPSVDDCEEWLGGIVVCVSRGDW